MRNRRALLIGVPEYDSEKIDNLLIVNQDIEFLHSSLEKSGFSVRSLGTDGEEKSTQNKIKQEIRKECKEAKNTDILLLYFSGHGIHYQGKDYLVPSDANLDDAEFIKDYLISTDLGEIVNLDICNAQTIIFFIDACREGIKLAWKSLSLASFGKGDRAQISKRRCVLVFACESGQYSQYVSDENGFSLFSKALAEVIDPQYPATTLEQILKSTQIKLNDLVQEHQKKEQKIHYSLENSVDDNILSRVICEGLITDITPKEVENTPWVEAVLQSPLWQDQERNESSTIYQLKEQVINIVRICWQKWQEAIQSLPQDVWRDQQFPLRMLASLELLISRSDPTITLSAAETAIIIAVPFIREAVLANGVIEAVKADPLSLDEKGIKVDFGSALDKLHQSQPRFIRKAKRLQEQGRKTDKDAVMIWLMHRCLLKTIEIWMAKPDSGYLSDEFINELENFDKNKPVLVKETLQAKPLLELARCTLVDIERIDRDDRPNSLHNKLTVGTYRDEQDIREKMLAYLLKLAGLLAVDIRTLSDVLVDHIGLSDPLNPEDVIDSLNQARWNPVGKGRTLKITCHHPAVDLALKDHIKGIEEILSHIMLQISEKQGDMNVLQGLPTSFLPNGITAEKHNNVPVYQTPHVNFQLAHDEIRELLMGEQLYGDPTLAIRELYQNALDACRYREARLKYLQQIGKHQGGKWEGKIIFRQGIDEKGREYIECEDNGIGMEIQHLSQCFARAGRRFVDLPEFIEEQADWIKCDPPIYLYPNSQFGIGVLSYFMLTDEIEVETCRLDHQGKPARQLRVRIPGSSGLFRMQDLGKGRDSGTRIRLYLNRTHYQNKPISCLEILKRLLWVAEYKTEVKEFDQQEFWESGQLRHPELSNEFYVNANHPNLWWITDKGCILSDGLATEELHPCIIVNLCHSHRPNLTVDRKKIVKWDQSWAREELIKGGGALLNWSSLSMEWLWELEKSEIYVAEKIADLLIHNNMNINTTIEVKPQEFSKVAIPIVQIGCCLVDKDVEKYLDPTEYGNTIYQRIYSHRKTIWQNYKIENPLYPLYSSSCISYPVLLPGDTFALLLTNNSEDRKLKEYKLTNFVFLSHLIRASFVMKEPLAKTVKRLQKFEYLGLKIQKVDPEIMGDICASAEDLLLLDVNLNGKSLLEKREILLDDLALASINLNEAMNKLYWRLQKFAFLGIKLPKINLELLNKLNFIPNGEIFKLFLMGTNEKLLVSSSYTFSYNSSILNSRAFQRLIYVLRKYKFTYLNGVFEFISSEEIHYQKKHLNYDVFYNNANYYDNEKNIDIIISEKDMIIFSKKLDGNFPFFKINIPRWQIVRASFKLNENIAKTLKRAQRFIPLGVNVSEANPIDLGDFTVNQDDLITLSYNLDQKEPWIEDEINLNHILRVSMWLKQPVVNVLIRLQKLAPLGFKVPEISLELLDNLIVTQADLIVLSQDLDGAEPWLKGKVTDFHITCASERLNEPVKVTLKRLHRFAAMLNLKLPEKDIEI
jgi:hypothetical protein